MGQAAAVKFTEWTRSGEMRHPVYLGMREDKRAEDVVLEREKPRKYFSLREPPQSDGPKTQPAPLVSALARLRS